MFVSVNVSRSPNTSIMSQNRRFVIGLLSMDRFSVLCWRGDIFLAMYRKSCVFLQCQCLTQSAVEDFKQQDVIDEHTICAKKKNKLEKNPQQQNTNKTTNVKNNQTLFTCVKQQLRPAQEVITDQQAMLLLDSITGLKVPLLAHQV